MLEAIDIEICTPYELVSWDITFDVRLRACVDARGWYLINAVHVPRGQQWPIATGDKPAGKRAAALPHC